MGRRETKVKRKFGTGGLIGIGGRGGWTRWMDEMDGIVAQDCEMGLRDETGETGCCKWIERQDGRMVYLEAKVGVLFLFQCKAAIFARQRFTG